MPQWSTRPNRWIVWLRLEQSISKDKKLLISEGINIDNQNEILATLIGTAMKPRYWEDENWQWKKVPKKELIEGVYDDLTQLDLEIAYLSWMQQTPITE